MGLDEEIKKNKGLEEKVKTKGLVWHFVLKSTLILMGAHIRRSHKIRPKLSMLPCCILLCWVQTPLISVVRWMCLVHGRAQNTAPTDPDIHPLLEFLYSRKMSSFMLSGGKIATVCYTQFFAVNSSMF